MVAVPSAIVFCSNNLSDSALAMIEKQLFINETIDGYVFDDRVAAEPTYVNIIKQFNLRLMVLRSFDDLTNRELADIAIYVKNGLACLEKNKFGPPGLTVPVISVSWGTFGIY